MAMLLKSEAQSKIWLGMWIVDNTRACPSSPDIHYAKDFLWQEAKNKCIQDKGDQPKHHLRKKEKYLRINCVGPWLVWLSWLGVVPQSETHQLDSRTGHVARLWFGPR